MAKHCLSFWVTTVFSFITGIWLLTTLIMFDKSENVENGNCLIDNVQYTQNISDTQNMIRCDCGRNCKSDEGMCIKIYVLMDNITYMAGSDLHESINTCTFQEEMCKKKTRYDALVDTQNTANTYIRIKQNNETIPCYLYNGNVYLDNTFNMDIMIGSIICFTSCFLYCMYSGCMIWYNDRKKSVNKTIV